MANFTVTLACANPLYLARDIQAAKTGGAVGAHIDIMDGHYVPNFCMNFDQARAISEAYPDFPLDVHLMVSQPFEWLNALRALHPQRAALHLDSTPFVRRFLGCLRQMGIRPGVVLNPSQPTALLQPLMADVEYVLLMGVEPGFSGQVIFADTYRRVEEIARMRKEAGAEFSIMVDGGIDLQNGPLCAQAGADILVGGAWVCFGQEDGVEVACRRFKQKLQALHKEDIV